VPTIPDLAVVPWRHYGATRVYVSDSSKRSQWPGTPHTLTEPRGEAQIDLLARCAAFVPRHKRENRRHAPMDGPAPLQQVSAIRSAPSGCTRLPTMRLAYAPSGAQRLRSPV
jgi:hypothetical protein